jgi:hypothetical protein
MTRILIGAALALALVSPAHAQVAPITTTSCNPNFIIGQNPNAFQWNFPGACAFPKAGGVLGGPLQLPPSTTTQVPLVIPHGAPPTAPIPNGAIWTTTAGLFVQINGATVGPLGTGGGGGGGGGSPSLQFNVASNSMYLGALP